MIMKKKILAMSIAATLGAAGSAVAAPVIQEAGVGHALIVPYFTTQAGYSTLLSITNTDPTNAKAVKIRFRSAVDSDDIFDFQVFLSPNDVWTANVSQDPTSGLSTLTTTDKSCTLPTSVNQAFVTGRLLSYTDAGGTVHSVTEQTREGYIEIFNMADIRPTLPNTSVNPLFTAVKHVNGVAPCTSATLLGIEAAGGVITTPTVADSGGGTMGAAAYNATQQVTMPTTGLMGNWVIIDVPNTRTFSGGMPAIQHNAQTLVVYSGQTGTAGARTPVDAVIDDVGPAINTFPALQLTADGVLLAAAAGKANGVTPADYDFPDMSTPFEAVAAQDTPTTYVTALSGTILRKSVINEFVTDSSISAGTDWVMTMPTRRYHVAGRSANYATALSSAGTGLGLGAATITGPFVGVTTHAANGRSALVATGASAAYWDREETAATGGGAVISPGTPTLYSLAGEVNVLSWNNSGTSSSVLGGSVILANSSTGTVQTGWASQATPGAGGFGLPFLGNAFIKAANPFASAGVSGNYGISYPHRYK